MSTSIFNYNRGAFGGTEYMAVKFHKDILPLIPILNNYTCVIFPGMIVPRETLVDTSKKVIFWLHNTVGQFHPLLNELINDPEVIANTQNIITVSEYHKSVVETEVPGIDKDKIIVIPNAIDPSPIVRDKFDNIDKVKIIHASSADRGMVKLLTSLIYCDEDFELNIYNDFYPDLDLRGLHEKLVSDPRVVFHGKSPRPTVLKAFAESHIHAYPSTYPETSCLVQMETLSAGCYSLHSNLGALPETSLGFGTMLDNTIKPSQYGQYLAQTIRNIKANGYDYQEQVDAINNKFSWDQATKNWIAFAKTLEG